ncbi:YadA family autotransporter adhesin [Burkholderia territorii]|uniref:Transporter n=1 Tax=Burkholderia territorii TaxID=1503055 RepID=A0A6L3NPH5_9BURK|nr:ESPR-type extended signal peptide-containing protein [Burkholderia territorii]KAB0686450.1 transporter [Burkholderia territorii]MBM2775657.1 YadA-like family protein [Burkholderia territorii]VWB70531.1 collagen-binding trimeric autotransporter adhesin [Burkholderia territorii]
MNKTYLSIWNAATNTWTAVSETAKSHSKGASRATRKTMIAIALGGATMGTAMADVCTTNDGSRGTVDATGACTAAGASLNATRALAETRATLDDTYIQVRGTTTDAKSEGNRAIAIGDGAVAGAAGITDAAQTNIAIGANANTSGGFGQMAFGEGASAMSGAGGAIAIGRNATTTNRGVALGDGATATGYYSIALGDLSVASANNTVSVGSKALQRRIVNVAKGTADTDAVNVGQMNARLSTTDTQLSALDSRTTANEGDIKQLDSDMTAAKNDIAMHTTDISTINGRLDNLSSGTSGLVQQATAGEDLTVGANTDGAAVNFSGTAGTRKLTGIAAGEVSAASSDAANGAQLHGIADSVATAIGGDSVVNTDGTISAPSFTIGDGKGGTTTVNTLAGAVANLDGRTVANEGDIKQLADRIGSGAIGVVQQDQTAGMIAVGANSGGTVVNFAGTGGARTLSGIANGVNDDEAVTIAQLRATGLIDYTGKEVGAVTYDSGMSFDTVTLAGALGTSLRNVAPGEVSANSMDAVNGSQLFGLQEQFAKQFGELHGRVDELSDRVTERENAPGAGGPGTGGSGSTVNGEGSSASGENSSAIGQGSNSSGGNSSAVGQGAVASGGSSSAVGQGSVASGENSTAIGQGTSATGSGSVALGQGSVADRDNAVSVGSAGHERQITNVADGTAPTDAINKRQLDGAMQSVDQRFGETNRMINDVAKNAYAGIAAAMAMPNMTPSQPGKTVVAVGAANFKSGSAVAAGATYRSRNGNWLVNGAVSVTSVGDAGVRAQVGYEF